MLCQITSNLALSKRTDSEHYKLASTSVSEDCENQAYLFIGRRRKNGFSTYEKILLPEAGYLKTFPGYSATSRAPPAKGRTPSLDANEGAPSSRIHARCAGP